MTQLDHTLVGVSATLATIVGLIVWVVKLALRRQSEITDRYFKHLEEQQLQSQATTDRLVSAFEGLNANHRETSMLLGELTKEVVATRAECRGICRHTPLAPGEAL